MIVFSINFSRFVLSHLGDVSAERNEIGVVSPNPPSNSNAGFPGCLQPFLNGWKWWTNHFLHKDLEIIQLKQPFINGWPWGSRYISFLDTQLKTTYVFWKNDGWETTFVSKWSLFEGHVSISGMQWFVYISVSALLSDNDHCLGKSLRISTIHPSIPTFPMNLQGVSSVSTVSLKLFHGPQNLATKTHQLSISVGGIGSSTDFSKATGFKIVKFDVENEVPIRGSNGFCFLKFAVGIFFCFLWLLFWKVLGRGLGFVCYISRHDMYLFMYTYLCKYAFLFGR